MGPIRSCTLAALLLFAATARAALDEPRCHVGLYRLTDGTDVDIAPVAGEHLRWRRKDGTTGELTRTADGWTSTFGWTNRDDGKRVWFSSCDARRIRFAGVDGSKVTFDEQVTHFDTGGARLAGRLILPPGKDRVPIVVLVHGSENSSALDYYALQRLFPAAGIGAFVYDKRGTGQSSGRYTHDYLQLALDLVAATGEARRLAGARVGSIGYQAGSQGGWVAPLAARIQAVDFVIVCFGLAVSPQEEEREALALDVTRHGLGAAVMPKAMELADASIALIRSHFETGYEQLDDVRRKYAGEPWFKFLRGDVSHILLQQSDEWIRREGPKLLADINPDYDPMPVLRNLDVPQLWLLGADDIDAPSAQTSRRLQQLANAGKPITLVMFDKAEHGLYEYEVAPDGERLSTRQPADYFRMMRDFAARRQLAGPYSTGRVLALPSRRP